MSDKVKRPKKIVVGHVTYRVHYYEEAEWLGGPQDNDLVGYYEAPQACIHIRLVPNCHENFLREVMVHEIIHAVWFHQNIRDVEVDESGEEKVVANVALGLLPVLRQNPKLMAWLLDSA